jgi:hypothetical protein
MRGRSVRALALFACVTFLNCANGQDLPPKLSVCVEEAVQDKTLWSSDLPPKDEFTGVIAQVLKAFASKNRLFVVPCHRAEKAQAARVPQSKKLPAGNYIFYDESWLKELTAMRLTQLIAVLGHEVGHFEKEHFTNRRHVPRERQEEEADRFAGCAVARLGRDSDNLIEVLNRLRFAPSAEYPDRFKSVSAALEGYKECRSDIAPTPVQIRLQTSRRADLIFGDPLEDLRVALNPYRVRIEALPPDAVVRQGSLIESVQRGTLDGGIVEATSHPKAAGIVVFSCSANKWLVFNETSWDQLDHRATTAVTRYCNNL